MLTGTLTLFCLDLAEGARLLEFMPRDAHKAIATCNGRALELAEQYGGEIHSELGLESSMLVAFSLASVCVEMVSDLHRYLLAQPWITPRNLFRTAILTGEIGGVDDEPLLHSLRALTDLARPGQILVGESTHAIVQRNPPEGHAFFNLGLNHLEDGGRGQNLYQLLHPELPNSFQPLPASLAAASNLPSGGTPFVGRLREIEGVKSGFYYSTVVSLVGFGGVGKSRLALEVARGMLEDHFHGACYVDLTDVHTKNGMFQAVATALSVHENTEQKIEQVIIEKLRPLEKLLVIDNATDVVAELAMLLGLIRDLCPQVQVITTSRKQIPLSNIHQLPVNPMDAPLPAAHHKSSDIARVDSVALFLNRASLINDAFEITDQNAALIGAICTKLDGIPLAIELAAAKTAHMDLDRIADNLDDRFSIPANAKSKSAPPLERAIRWSFDGLRDYQQTLLLRLCAFAGPFTRESAVKVASCGSLSEDQASIAIDELTAQSYLIKSFSHGVEYLLLLDTIRDFGRAIVVERGETIVNMDRHSDYFATRATDVAPRMYGNEQEALVNELHITYRNYVVAFDWSIEASGCDRAQMLVRALYIYWHHKSMFAEGARWAEEVLKRSTMEPRIRAKLHIIAGTLAAAAGGYVPADKHFKSALRIGQRINDTDTVMRAHCALGTNHLLGGEVKPAIAHLEKALTLARELKDDLDIADICNNLGGNLVDDRQHEVGRKYLFEALDINSKLDRPFGVATNNYYLGRSYRMAGELDHAPQHLEIALRNYIAADDNRGIAATLREFALLRIQAGAHHTAAILLGADEGTRRIRNIQVSLNKRTEIEKARATLETSLGPHFLVEYQKGMEMDRSQINEFLLIGQLPA
jgi:predicted ATPase